MKFEGIVTDEIGSGNVDRHPGHDGRTVADLGGDLDVPTSVPGTRLHIGESMA